MFNAKSLGRFSYTQRPGVRPSRHGQVQCGEASVEEDRRRILHAICGSDGTGCKERLHGGTKPGMMRDIWLIYG